MKGLFASIATWLHFDPAVLPGAGVFALKVVAFCVPFVLLGFYLEKRVDGREKIDRTRRVVKAAIFVLFVLPMFGLGFLNYLNTIRPILLAEYLEKHPDLQNLIIMDGLLPPLVLIGVLTLFSGLYLVETLRGRTND